MAIGFFADRRAIIFALCCSDLDYFSTVKLVNYIRSEVKHGNQKPDVSSKSFFDDDKYMMPALEDDALLYSLDDIFEDQLPVTTDDKPAQDSSDSATRIQQLEQELSRLRGQFDEYKEMVRNSLDRKIVDEGKGEDNVAGCSRQDLEAPSAGKFHRAEEDYFSSYSYNGRTAADVSETRSRLITDRER
jgi:protein arginine N-methyltransferase 3